MAMRGQGVVDQVDILAVHQRVVIGLNMRDAVRFGIGARLVRVARCHGDDFAIITFCSGLDDGLGANLGGAEYADTDHENSLGRTDEGSKVNYLRRFVYPALMHLNALGRICLAQQCAR